MGKWHLKTVSGVNGVVLNKHVEFLTGERSVKYEWLDTEKTFQFLVKSSLVPEEKRGILEYFEKFYRVRIKFI